MTIADKAQALFSRLEKIKESKSGRDEAGSLDVLCQDLAKRSKSINYFSVRKAMLEKEGVTLPKVPEVDPALDAVKKAKNAFTESPKSTTLRTGRRWKSLIDRLDLIDGVIEKSQKKAWEEYFEMAFFVGESPDRREAQVAKTSENIESLRKYRDLYPILTKFRSQIPVDTEQFKYLRQLSERLAQIQFREDIPDDVGVFIAAARGRGASLDLLTPEVTNWLRKNHSLGNYIIKAKST